jgi:hypothetical protein
MKNSGSGFGVLIALIILIGAYVAFESPDTNAFRRVERGDSTVAVIQRMGRPQAIESRKPRLHDVELEYQYYLWPLRTRYCIGFRGEQVVDKGVFDGS